MSIKALAVAIGGLRRRVALAAAAAVIAVLGVPGVSSAASGPSCGNPNGTGSPCYVTAEYDAPNGYPTINSMAGLFTVPKSLNVTAPAYTIAQIALIWGYNDIELGWVVAPGIYGGSQVPHLFIYIRSPAEGNCQEGAVRPNGPASVPYCTSKKFGSNFYFQSLTSNNLADWAIHSPSAFFYVAYDSTNSYWYIQYQNQYIARVRASYWGGQFDAGDTAQWYGEVHTDGVPCTPMGNGVLGSHPGSATVSDMLWGNGVSPTMFAATAKLSSESYRQYWDSNRPTNQTFSSFRFGGPGYCT